MVLYANAPESTLALLDRVQNQGLRLALRAIKTTPIPSLQYESKIPSLLLRRIRLAEQYVFKAIFQFFFDF